MGETSSSETHVCLCRSPRCDSMVKHLWALRKLLTSHRLGASWKQNSKLFFCSIEPCRKKKIETVVGWCFQDQLMVWREIQRIPTPQKPPKNCMYKWWAKRHSGWFICHISHFPAHEECTGGLREQNFRTKKQTHLKMNGWFTYNLKITHLKRKIIFLLGLGSKF